MHLILHHYQLESSHEECRQDLQFQSNGCDHLWGRQNCVYRAKTTVLGGKLEAQPGVCVQRQSPVR